MPRARSTIAILAVLTACAGALSAAPALAAQTRPVADCNAHGRLTQKYSNAQLRNALNTMSADVKEYTNCYDVIQRALLAQLGTPSGGSTGAATSGGSFLPTPVIIVLVLLILAALAFAAAAIRRRGSSPGDGP
jgi:hypothetical protein